MSFRHADRYVQGVFGGRPTLLCLSAGDLAGIRTGLQTRGIAMRSKKFDFQISGGNVPLDTVVMPREVEK
jgi:hypothetical protein